MDDTFNSALKYSLRLLGYRDRSKSEMRNKLLGKGFPEDIVNETLSYLEEKAFIDDRKLAGLLKRDAIERRHFGAEGIRSYLIKRGIAKDLADEMSFSDEGYFDTAMQLAERKMSSIKHLDCETIKRRLWGLLARRGFSADEIRKVIERIMTKDEI